MLQGDISACWDIQVLVGMMKREDEAGGVQIVLSFFPDVHQF